MIIIKDGQLEETTLIEKLVGFEIPPYDDIDLNYTSGNLTSLVYDKDVVEVATLTLSYNASNELTNITKS